MSETLLIDQCKSIQIVQVANGYIVNVLRTGENGFREPFVTPVFVENSKEKMLETISLFFEDPSHQRSAE